MSNLYAAPTADMASPLANSQTYLPRMFELNGRIGRVRYLVYASVISIIMFAVIGVVLALLAKSVGLTTLLAIGLIMWIPMFVILYYVLRRRLHDLGKSGWFGLLQFFPLLNIGFILWVLFARGNDASNEYGPPPAANTRPLVIAAWLIPIAMLASMPSYFKFEEEMLKKMSGGGADAAAIQKQMEAAVEAAEAQADSIEGVGNDTGKEEQAPAEPKAAN